MERVMGIEPTLAAWEAAVLPLNYTRVWPQFYLTILDCQGEIWQQPVLVPMISALAAAPPGLLRRWKGRGGVKWKSATAP